MSTPQHESTCPTHAPRFWAHGWVCTAALLLAAISSSAQHAPQHSAKHPAPAPESAPPAAPQLIQQQIKASRLQGTVVLIGTGADPIADAKLDLHTCVAQPGGKSWKPSDKILATATTDAKGHFAFAKNLKPKNACLEIHADSYNPMLLMIRYGMFSGQMKIRLHVAS